MTKSATTPLKLFQWLLTNLTVTMAGLHSLPFHQMPTKRSLCSTTDGEEKVLSTRRCWGSAEGHPSRHAMPLASGQAGMCPLEAVTRAFQGLAAGGAWQVGAGLEEALPAPGMRNWVGSRAVSSSHSPCSTRSDVCSSPSPLPRVFVGTGAQPSLLGIDYFSLSSLIH